MSIGERIKGARKRANLSLRDLAEKVGVSAQAISKYERNLDVPGSSALIKLARSLEVRVEYLLRPLCISLSQPSYRSYRSKLRVQDEELVNAQVQDWLERYISVEEIVNLQTEFHMPAIDRKVKQLDDIERVALDLREFWQIGLDPIENLIEILETQGIKVGVVKGADNFDALTLMANENIPIIVVKDDVPGDRKRLSIAHELGHLILELPEDMDEEKAAYRFAGAFLVPKPSAYRELGEKRQQLDFYELHLLKHKYGMSMQAWIYRAQDLNILSKPSVAAMYRKFNMNGWKRHEPGDPYPSERTDRLERLVLRALTEDMISETRAEELLGMSLADFWMQASKQHDGLPLPIHR